MMGITGDFGWLCGLVLEEVGTGMEISLKSLTRRSGGSVVPSPESQEGE